ncbi:ArdC family protein [Aliivibrio fischeri]
MTHSTAINSTITKETKATNVSPFEQSGSNKNEMGKKRSFGKKRAVVKVSKDIYQMVTDRVIAALENGVKPWVCPWDKTNECSMLPMNFKTKTNYSGINILLLWSETVEKGFTSPYWLTYKQANELGGNVMKGQKGTTIVYYKNWEKEDEEGNKEVIPMLRTFTVFNIDQVENIEKPMVTVKETREKSEFVKLSYVEEAIHNTEIKINHCGVRAFYSPAHDEITLPMVDRFNSSSDYYATAWHELVHATGHKSRLDRDLKNSFGSKDYAFEELVAELGAAFCCADLGIVGDVQHESYIVSWLERLNGDKKFIFKAASQASKAHQWLLK